MNYNILAYTIYLTIMVYIIVYVGRLFYNNGRVFILGLFKGNVEQTDYVNTILLVAYYLFNIGYAFLKLRFWTNVTDVEVLVSSLGTNIGVLILILAVTHYFNMWLIYYLSKRQALFH
ncbi:hypothetical protein [Polluticoccus soli]|uniref:hypothetical protein n=1 Tax=Polluticoccus soli TaxID=3034150 RepID=UPI0023E13744|nr:hypothetical protein [Flavipsychrobacter sp. JY13-12]